MQGEGARSPRRVVIMGAAGRDFHDFNVRFRDDPDSRVVAFTAAQIPDIADRRYPPSLAGPRYPEGVPIRREAELAALIRAEDVDEVLFSYSDLSHAEVMHRASIALAAGADFRLLAPASTMLRAERPVVAVCAVRTGVGKSAVSRYVVAGLRDRGLRISAVRHPMPYGDLERQAVQHFATLEDLARAEATIEEREEYEPYLAMGASVFAGVDYARILERAQRDADALLWDGGNNDVPFYRPDLHLVLVDAHRPGHELAYHPGETNLRMADAIVINKVDTADPKRVDEMRRHLEALRPGIPIVLGEMPVVTREPEAIRGARVVIVGDGPTLTHGGMATGAGSVAARACGAAEIVDARSFAVGSIAQAYAAFPHLGPELPALGYGPAQVRDLEETLRRTPCDVVIDATPACLRSRVRIDTPIVEVDYHFSPRGDVLDGLLDRFAEDCAP
jgi:predicted GTPase